MHHGAAATALKHLRELVRGQTDLANANGHARERGAKLPSDAGKVPTSPAGHYPPPPRPSLGQQLRSCSGYETAWVDVRAFVHNNTEGLPHPGPETLPVAMGFP